MNFQCPSCSIVLQAEPEYAGKAVKCPSCNTKIDIPADFGQVPDENLAPDSGEQTQLHNYPELNLNYKTGTHPARINTLLALIIGLGITGLVILVAFILPKDFGPQPTHRPQAA